MARIVAQKFQWFFDMATTTDCAQLIEIKAGGEDILKRLSPFFLAYKNFKLGSVKIRMVPAATLPVDPTGLSYEAGEQTVDPRDVFNPGLVRITNGEDNKFVLQNQSGYGILSEGTYYATMLDPRWFKFRLQAGFKRSATPRFWSIGQIHQDAWPGWTENIPNNTGFSDVDTYKEKDNLVSGVQHGSVTVGSSNLGFFQTGQKIKMGWLPTQMCETVPGYDTDNVDPAIKQAFNEVPEIPLITCILPKAYKTKFYYRVYVTETVMFKDPVAYNPYTNTDGTFLPADSFMSVMKYTSATLEENDESVSGQVPPNVGNNGGLV